MNNEVKALKDLRSGYVVELRNGKTFLVTRVGRFTRALVRPGSCQWHYLESTYNDDMTSKKKMPCLPYAVMTELDIMKVWGLMEDTTLYYRALEPNVAGRKLLWSRQEAKKLTVDEISKLLGYEVEIVGGCK